MLEYGQCWQFHHFFERKVLYMICLNCGKTVDDDVRVCPFCGALIEAEVSDGAAADDPMPINLPHRESRAERVVERAEYEAPKKAAPVPE